MARRLLASVIVVGLTVLVSFLVAKCRPAQNQAPVHGAGSATVTTSSPALPPETRVRRLPAAERQQLAERIAAARARARQAEISRAAATPSPALPSSDDEIRLEQVSPAVRKSLEESIPILAECFHDKQPKQTATVMMTMYSDPSVGMVIDTAEMTDEDGKPLASELDDCLGTTIESLALPPLEVGGHLPLQYSFRFTEASR